MNEWMNEWRVNVWMNEWMNEESWMRGQQTCPLYNTFLTCEQ